MIPPESDILILFLIYSRNQLSIGSIQDLFFKVTKTGLHYNTIRDKLVRWISSGIVEKRRKSTLELGGDRFIYQLTKKGAKIVKTFIQFIIDSMDLIKYQDVKLQINKFIDRFPTILNEIEMTLNEDQNRKLEKKIKAFFKDFI